MNPNNWFNLIEDKLLRWWLALIKMLPNMILAALVLTFFIFFSKTVRRWLNRFLSRIIDSPSLSGLFSSIIYFVILFTGIFIALDILKLDKAVTSLLAGAGIIGLALGFAFQDLSANFISGIFITFKKPFDVGHTVETNGYLGNIEAIQLRTTTIRTAQGLHLMIPNKEIFQKPLINYSLTPERRIELEFNIPTTTDLSKGINLILQEMNRLPYLHQEKKPEVYFTAIQDTTVKLVVWCWIYTHQAPGFMAARHELISNISNALKTNEADH